MGQIEETGGSDETGRQGRAHKKRLSLGGSAAPTVDGAKSMATPRKRTEGGGGGEGGGSVTNPSKGVATGAGAITTTRKSTTPPLAKRTRSASTKAA